MVDFVTVEDRTWADALDHCPHDLYHLPAYVRLEADWVGARPIAFVHGDGPHVMLVPLLERSTPGGVGYDAVTPYGYSSPVFTDGSPTSFRLQALRMFQAAARDRGLITSFMRLHPLLQPALDGLNDLESAAGGTWSQQDRGVTLTMPLDLDEASFAAGMAHGHRVEIARLRDAGCRVDVDTEQAWAAFPGIYRFTMEKVGAAAAYFYDDDYIAAFRRDLVGYAHCGAVIDQDGAVMCAGLFTHVSGILQYHLSGTADGYSKRAPMKLLLAGMRDWARARNVRHFHLGGGLGARRDSLYKFKRQFGGNELPFRTVAVVHDGDAFHRETARWRDIAGPDAAVEGDFFPLYRAPLPNLAYSS